uniref:Glycosyltransferase n=1 Tax=Fagopyrum tataricum TaxID=62330 RepID=A0A6B7ENZ6_FAGTA|nr:UGT85A66 [Fagopyrum tataricum]
MEFLSGNQADQKPHVVCVPYPAQGHINPMMKLAKLLHSHGGFHVTFVHTHYNHARLLRSRGPRALDGLPSFKFASIPDGLPVDPDGADVTQDTTALCASVDRHCLTPFTDLLRRMNKAAEEGGVPPVTSIVGDVAMMFSLEAAEDLGIKHVTFWTVSACGFLGYDQYPRLVQEGYIPLKGASYLTNGYLDTHIDWIPGMKGIRLKDLPTFVRTTDPNDIMVNLVQSLLKRTRKSTAVILNTFDALEQDVLAALALNFPPIYAVGPLHMLVDRLVQDEETKLIGSNLWKEDQRCIEWLDSREPNSVVYVNFGSITVMSNHQLVEFAFGLANSGKHFLWIIRPDLVTGESAVLPSEFVEEIKGRGLLAEWCEQERVLCHPAIGGFLTHSGWNSVLESICGGIPMISWPFFAEQQMNCWYSSNVWGIGMEIDEDVKRDAVEKQVIELIDGEHGKEMKRRTMEWKSLAEAAVSKPIGQSLLNLKNLITHILPFP